MFRANLHLHPHPPPNSQSKLASVPPGAFPTFTSVSSSGSDFARTIKLTPEIPIQPIGRSSRNAAKGLVADRNNGFFESAVMSRAHAEVRLVLEPTRKIIIRDTKSMHGTFVNGLPLREDEPAELLQGTEVTFGCEVTRGEEVFPPKTFRCEVEWEDMSSPKASGFGLPDKNKTRGGYGVSAEELAYGSAEELDEEEDEEEDEEDEEEQDVDISYLDLPPSDEDKASSSGESSPPSSAIGSPVTQNIGPAYVGASTSKISYIMDDDAPVSHERSTKDLSVQALTKNEERMEQLKKKISESITAVREKDRLETPEFVSMQSGGDPARPGVTIRSLMNRALDPNPRDENDKDRNSGKRSTRKSLPECDFYIYDDLTLEDDEVEVIPKEKFQAAAKSSSESRLKQPIVIDDDEDDLFSDDDDEMDECVDMAEEDEQDDEDEEEASSDDEEQIEKDVEMKDKENVPTENPTTHEEATNVVSQLESMPMSPPDIMSSKIPVVHLDALFAPPHPNFRSTIEELTHAAAAVAAMQAPTPPPSATLPPLSKIHRETIIKKTASGASHIHWLAENATPTPKNVPFPASYPDPQHTGIGSMEQKKEYFAAREFNRSRDARVYKSQDDSNILCPPKSPAPLPYVVNGMPWAHGSNNNEPLKEASGLFPNILESEKTESTASPVRTDKGKIPSPPPTVSSQAKRLLEDAVAEGEKIQAGTSDKYWWPNVGGEVGFEIDDDAEVQWDDDIANDEDGEYDEEEDEEQNKEDGDEDEEDITNLDFEYEEEYEDEPECDLADEQQEDDDIRSDVSEYGGSLCKIDLANDDTSVLPSQGIFAAASSSNNCQFVRTSVSEAGKSDFTKSRGFSISNLVNENIIPPPRPQLAVTGTFYPPRPLISLPCRPVCQIGQPSGSNPIPSAVASLVSQAKKEKSMADLLNPSSPAAGCKRKHEEISNVFPEEVLETECPRSPEPFNPDNMDETDDDLEPQGENEEQKEDNQPTSVSSANLDEASKNTCATTTNTAVQVSGANMVKGESERESEPAKKKTRTDNSSGQQIARFAATALAGAIVGGVGMFAALVATAPAP